MSSLSRNVCCLTCEFAVLRKCKMWKKACMHQLFIFFLLGKVLHVAAQVWKACQFPFLEIQEIQQCHLDKFSRLMVRLSLGHMFTVTKSNISWPR